MNPTRFARLLPVLLLLLPLRLMADDLLLQGLDGGSRQLSEFTGKGNWTVVMIWSAHCGVCQYEAPKVEGFARKHRDGRIEVLGLSIDGVEGAEDARGFVREHGLSFASFLADPEEIALLFYDATGTYLAGTPAFLVYNPQGDLRTYQLGTMNMATLEQFIRQQSGLVAAEGKQS